MEVPNEKRRPAVLGIYMLSLASVVPLLWLVSCSTATSQTQTGGSGTLLTLRWRLPEIQSEGDFDAVLELKLMAHRDGVGMNFTEVLLEIAASEDMRIRREPPSGDALSPETIYQHQSDHLLALRTELQFGSTLAVGIPFVLVQHHCGKSPPRLGYTLASRKTSAGCPVGFVSAEAVVDLDLDDGLREEREAKVSETVVLLGPS